MPAGKVVVVMLSGGFTVTTAGVVAAFEMSCETLREAGREAVVDGLLHWHAGVKAAEKAAP